MLSALRVCFEAQRAITNIQVTYKASVENRHKFLFVRVGFSRLLYLCWRRLLCAYNVDLVLQSEGLKYPALTREQAVRHYAIRSLDL
jgi:hypothetical protein